MHICNLHATCLANVFLISAAGASGTVKNKLNEGKNGGLPLSDAPLQLLFAAALMAPGRLARLRYGVHFWRATR
jgi:hypothetical protein